MGLPHITKESVLAAIEQYDRMGMKPFLDRYGFAKPKSYWLYYRRKPYVSKAIGNIAQAIGMNQPYSRSITLAGGGALVKRLRAVGFKVVEKSPELDEKALTTESSRNPDWTRDELILALELYARNPNSPPSKSSREVKELSGLLRRLGDLNDVEGDDTYRNVNGVYLKMMNFRSLDPQFKAAGKSGMTRSAKGDLAVWEEFEGRSDALRATAKVIRESISDPSLFKQMAKIDPVDEGAEEGGVSYRRHRIYERDRSLRLRKKEQVMKSQGKLACEACDFDFAATYGELGEGYIEVHHNRPVSQMKPGEKTKLKDLALLCGNCHRIAHRRKEVISVEEIRALLK